MFASHLKAGSGAVAIETREEERLVSECLMELKDLATEFAIIAVATGTIRQARITEVKGAWLINKDHEPPVRPAQGQSPLAAAYGWLAASPGRVLIVLDWHTLVNNPGHWRLLLENLPGIRSPLGCSVNDSASLAIFVSPTFSLEPHNPLKGQLPILTLEPPSRERLRSIANGIAELPENGEGEAVVDALCGLSADTAEQVCAEVIARNRGWDIAAMVAAKVQALRDCGLECLSPMADIGGLDRAVSFCKEELEPWIRDDQLAITRLLLVGVPGTGKSLFARYLAARLKCLCVVLSIPSLKAGIVGASEANLRRAFRIIDSMGRDAPIVVLLDELDKVPTDGLDGGTSSGMMQILLTHLQESRTQAIYLATSNYLQGIDAALVSRFQVAFFVDLPTQGERQSVAALHLNRLRCQNVGKASRLIASLTEGFSSREIAENVCPSLARLSSRECDDATARLVVGRTTPASKTQAADLEKMRSVASTLRRANSEDENNNADPSPTRKVTRCASVN